MIAWEEKCAHLHITGKAAYLNSVLFAVPSCCFFGLDANLFGTLVILGILDCQTESVSEQSLVAAS